MIKAEIAPEINKFKDCMTMDSIVVNIQVR
jgi:hypothetical protein